MINEFVYKSPYESNDELTEEFGYESGYESAGEWKKWVKQNKIQKYT